MAKCVVLALDGTVESVADYVDQSGCHFVALTPQELADISAVVAALPDVQSVAALYQPIDPSEFVALVSQASVPLVFVFFMAYMVGAVIRSVRA